MIKLRNLIYFKAAFISSFCLLTSCGTDKIAGEIDADEPGGVKTEIVLNPEWDNGNTGADDRTEGENGQYYYNFILESTFNPGIQTFEMAIADNVLYIPTGTYGPRPTDTRNVSVEYWDLNTRQKTGTLPMPNGLTSFTYRVHSLFRLENLLFVGHGEYLQQNRLEIYDISAPSQPQHITYVGGSRSYVPSPPSDNKLIGIPYAVWGKDDKLLLLDNFRLSVYDLKSFTAAKAGNITPVKFMSINSGAGDTPKDQAGFVTQSDGSIYLTDPSWNDPKGLRKINWNNVISATTGEVNDLIDETGLLLPGKVMKKAVSLDDNLLVFDNNKTNNNYSLTFFEPGRNDGIDCTVFFKPSLQEPGNGLLLSPTSEGKRRIAIAQGNGGISIYRIDKINLNDF